MSPGKINLSSGKSLKFFSEKGYEPFNKLSLFGKKKGKLFFTVLQIVEESAEVIINRGKLFTCFYNFFRKYEELFKVAEDTKKNFSAYDRDDLKLREVSTLAFDHFENVM